MTHRDSRAAKDKPKDVLDDANDFNGDEIYDVLSKAEGNVTDESRARRRVNKQSAGYNGGGAGYIEEDDGGYGYGGKKGKSNFSLVTRFSFILLAHCYTKHSQSTLHFSIFCCFGFENKLAERKVSQNTNGITYISVGNAAHFSSSTQCASSTQLPVV